MPSYANSTPEQLRKRLHEVESQLEKQEPELFAEMVLLRRLLAASADGGNLFNGIRSLIGAIEICLQTTGNFMTREEIFEMLSRGGFALKPNTGKYLVNDSIYYHVNKSGRLVERDEKIGLKKWHKRK